MLRKMQLSELQVKLYHENCWTSQIPFLLTEGNLIYPVARFHINSGTVTYTMVRGTKLQIKSLVQSDKLSEYQPRILGTLQNNNGPQIFMISFLFGHQNSVFNIIGTDMNVVPVHVTYKGEYEIWSFLGSDRDIMKRKERILGSLERVSSVEAYSIIDSSHLLRENIIDYLQLYFPPKINFFLQELSEIGYFDFPRKVSIEEAAVKLGVTKGYLSKVSRRIFDILKAVRVGDI